MSEDTKTLVQRARAILREKAVLELDEPIELASGQMSSHFIDGKAGLSKAADLRVACEAMHAQLASAGIDYDAVGGLTLGADHLAVGVALAGDREWFFVRKEPKGRGTGKQIEGAKIGPGSRVVVVEDIVSTGGSMFKAIEVVQASGAQVVAASTLIDRGGHAEPKLTEQAIPYFCLGSYADFNLPPVEPS